MIPAHIGISGCGISQGQIISVNWLLYYMFFEAYYFRSICFSLFQSSCKFYECCEKKYQTILIITFYSLVNFLYIVLNYNTYSFNNVNGKIYTKKGF